jgi:hypothetical protein
VLGQTVPESAKTEEVVEMETYFRELIRGVDSSLIEEWEKMRNPDYVAAEIADKPARPATFDITRDEASFKRLVRTAIYAFLQDVAARDWESAAERGAIPAESRRIETRFGEYFAAHTRFRLDPEGRSTKHTHWLEKTSPEEQEIAQVLIDSDDQNDWEARFTVLLGASRAESRAVVRFDDVRPI